MKLNSATEMLAYSLTGFSDLHPFAPNSQAQGYHQIFKDLEADLCDITAGLERDITGYDKISFQPDSRAHGEYAG